MKKLKHSTINARNLQECQEHLMKVISSAAFLNNQKMSREELKEELQGILDIETVITPEIAIRMTDENHDLMLLTGIGEVFPYIRSNNILNNLQKTAKDKPTLMFFPGEYQHSLESGASLDVELDEYVITNEVAKRLDLFLDAYLNYQGANGVWVSGFFGSGKSHLLKILALLLENKLIEDIAPLDVFLEKQPLNEGGIFANDLKRAVSIPSESILFNIDQKADVISKTEIDALIAVFVKVFDEHCGYYGKQAYIAQFD